MTFKRKNIIRFWISLDILVLISVVSLQFHSNKVFGCEENICKFGIGIKAYPAIGSIELSVNSKSRESANDFKFLPGKGRVINNSNQGLIREYLFEEQNSIYMFRLGIIPMKAGIYRISVSDAANVHRQGDKCTKASFRINFKSTNQHLYYNELNPGVVVPLPNNGIALK